jgi:hypothetical protein
MSLKTAHAAKKAGISGAAGHNIWTRAGQLEIDYFEKDLPPPTIKELVTIMLHQDQGLNMQNGSGKSISNRARSW